jgi:hypothetical protein
MHPGSVPERYPVSRPSTLTGAGRGGPSGCARPSSGSACAIRFRLSESSPWSGSARPAELATSDPKAGRRSCRPQSGCPSAAEFSTDRPRGQRVGGAASQLAGAPTGKVAGRLENAALHAPEQSAAATTTVTSADLGGWLPRSGLSFSRSGANPRGIATATSGSWSGASRDRCLSRIGARRLTPRCWRGVVGGGGTRSGVL